MGSAQEIGSLKTGTIQTEAQRAEKSETHPERHPRAVGQCHTNRHVTELPIRKKDTVAEEIFEEMGNRLGFDPRERITGLLHSLVSASAA